MKKIVVNSGSVIIDHDKILLVKQSEAPFVGKWNFPLGGLESDEDLPSAAIREAKEETGLEIELTHFLGVYQFLKLDPVNVITVMFRAKLLGGNLDFSKDEVLEAKWFETDELSKLELVSPEMINVAERALKDPRNLDNYVNY